MWKYAMLSVLALVLGEHCQTWDTNRDGFGKIAVIGDSNEDHCWNELFPPCGGHNQNSWVDDWQTANPNFTITSYASLGATACEYVGSLFESYQDQVDAIIGSGIPYDVVVISGMTNDHYVQENDETSTFNCLLAIESALNVAGFTAVIPTLVPPSYDASEPPTMDAYVAAINALISAHYGAGHFADFQTGFDSGKFDAGGLHFNATGKALCVDRIPTH